MERDDYTAANRRAWNEAAPKHATQRMEELLASFAQPGYSYWDDVATGILMNFGVAGKDVVQLCCNNGRELLSVKNMGAGRCVGFDISDEFIAQAHQLAAAGDIDCEFVRTDVYDIGPEYDAAFDLVFFTVGALTWLPDLDPVMATVARLLRPGGHLFIYDMHPVLEMFDETNTDAPLTVAHSYFKSAPFVGEDGIDYYSGQPYESSPSYCFIHKLSDVFTACLDHGLQVRAFTEYDHDIGMIFKHLEHSDLRPPMSFTLVCEQESQ